MWTEITDIVVFRKKLLKFRQGVQASVTNSDGLCLFGGSLELRMLNSCHFPKICHPLDIFAIQQFLPLQKHYLSTPKCNLILHVL